MANNETAKDVTLLVLGASVGAALGLLLAPKPGSETREQIADWLKERREKGGDLLETIKTRLPEQKEKVAALAREKKEQVAAALRTGKQAFLDATGQEEEEEETASA